MKLNANILYRNLKEKYGAVMYGHAEEDLTLRLPELYLDDSDRFLSGHVYLATVEHLPRRPVVQRGCVLVAIGDSGRLAHFEQHACVIQIKRKVDFYGVYRFLQQVYEPYLQWESDLLELFTKTPEVQEVLDCTYPVFECPIAVLNSSFQYVASTHAGLDIERRPSIAVPSDELSLENFLSYLKDRGELSMDRRGAFTMQIEQVKVLCVNLFDEADQYIGCLYVDITEHEYVEGENRLAEYLAAMIERIAALTPSLLENEQNSLKEALRCLMNEMPLSQRRRLALKLSNGEQRYACASIRHMKGLSTLPTAYICSILEAGIPGSIVFGQGNAILCLIPVKESAEDAAHALASDASILSLVDEVQLRIGISNAFSDLYMLRTFYFQAEAAIENGLLYRPGEQLYLFSEFALQEMATNAAGALPLESYFPIGFERLLDHDDSGGISYLETLTVFLEENMSYAKAARRLFIHRSTLIERIERIKKELGCDLDDPDERLLLQLLIKALSVERYLGEGK